MDELLHGAYSVPSRAPEHAARGHDGGGHSGVADGELCKPDRQDRGGDRAGLREDAGRQPECGRGAHRVEHLSFCLGCAGEQFPLPLPLLNH